MKLDDAQRRLARLCLGREPSADDVRALGATPERWALYRSLVRGRFVEALGDGLPRTRRALGDAGLASAVAAFLDEAPPSTRYVRELAPEFARHLERSPGALPASAPPWALDLARYEAAVMAAHVARDPSPEGVTDFDLELPAALSPAQRFLRVGWRVQVDVPTPEAAPSLGLLVYRRPDDVVETMEFTPVAADIYELMARGHLPVSACAREALARHDATAGRVFIESFAELLGDLLDRGVVLGSRAPT